MDNQDITCHESGVTNEQILTQMKKVLLSDQFRQAKYVSRFLSHIVNKKLAGEEDELKEYILGLEVFQRGTAYDPRTDSVVRVQANILRKKLASYYSNEGANDDIVIGLPKGHYVPCFSLKQELNGCMNSVENSASDLRASTEVIASQNIPVAGRQRFHHMAIALPLIVGMLISLVLVTSLTRHKKTSVNKAYMPLWDKFLEPGAPNILAYGTPQFFAAPGGVYFRDIQVNSAEEMSSNQRFKSIQENLQKKLVPTEVYTGVGETQGVYLLSRLLLESNKDLRVMRSRMIGWDEMKDCNLIFLSSMRFRTIAKELPIPTDFALSETGEHITNLHPQPGEEHEYRHVVDGDTKYDYAVVTLWPGKMPDRRVMVLSGSNTWSTLAAAEYVTSPEHLRQLDGHIANCQAKSGHEEHTPYFQVLLRVEIKDDQPVATHYVTHHDFDLNGQTLGVVAENKVFTLVE